MTTNDQSPNSVEENSNKSDLGTPSPFLIVFLLVPLIAILIVFVMLAQDIRTDRKITLPPQIDNPSAQIYYAAPDFSLETLDGGTVSLADYRGKILFLNFWQTTCVPCITEMPEFMNFMAEQNPDEVALLAINFDETPEDIRRFYAQYDIVGIPTALDRDSSVSQRYGVSGIPVTYIIDEYGNIRSLNIGGLTHEDMQQHLRQVQTAD